MLVEDGEEGGGEKPIRCIFLVKEIAVSLLDFCIRYFLSVR